MVLFPSPASASGWHPQTGIIDCHGSLSLSRAAVRTVEALIDEEDSMAPLLMPKATAVWLVENTTLTFDQIADFCGLHTLEVQGIADGEVAQGIVGLDPTTNGQLSKEEIERCEADPTARLKIAKSTIPMPAPRTKGPRYTPVAKRQDKPDAVAWLIRHHPELSDAQISKLIGTTKQTIAAVRDRSHWNFANLRPRDPVLLGLCSQSDLNAAVLRARKALEKAGALKEAVAPPAEAPKPETKPEEESPRRASLDMLSKLLPEQNS
jgi:hypothetical protein